jgi:hypothetical protein
MYFAFCKCMMTHECRKAASKCRLWLWSCTSNAMGRCRTRCPESFIVYVRRGQRAESELGFRRYTVCIVGYCPSPTVTKETLLPAYNMCMLKTLTMILGMFLRSCPKCCTKLYGERCNQWSSCRPKNQQMPLLVRPNVHICIRIDALVTSFMVALHSSWHR